MDLYIITFTALFSVINPIGTVPIFLALTQEDDKASKNKTALWASINVCIILVVTFFIGEYILQFLGISIDVLRIAGGIIICTSGFGLLSGTFSKKRGRSEERRVGKECRERWVREH